MFDKARTQIRYTILDPAGYGGNVASYLNTQQKIQDVVNRLETAYSRARDGEQLERAGKTQQAYEKWRLIFGDYFPTYG